MKGLLLNMLQGVPVVGWPKKTGLENYRKAIDEYIAALPNKGIKGIIQIGGVSHPGISDIDLIVVCNKGLKSNVKRFRADIAGQEHKHLLIHDPWFVNEMVWKNFGLLLPFFKCTTIYGDALAPEKEPVPALSPEIALLHLSESLINKIPRELLFNLVFCGRLNARLALVLASSFRYSARLFTDASGEEWPEAEIFSVRMDEIRSSVIDGERGEDSLRDLIAESVMLSFELVARTQRLWERVIRNPVAWRGHYRGYFDTEISPDWNKELAFGWSKSFSGRMRRSILLPPWSAWHLALLASGNNRFAQFVRNRIKNLPMVDAPAGLIEAAQKMAHAKSEYVAFGRQCLNYAGSLGITHGCGEGVFMKRGRPILKVYRALLMCR